MVVTSCNLLTGEHRAFIFKHAWQLYHILGNAVKKKPTVLVKGDCAGLHIGLAEDGYVGKPKTLPSMVVSICFP